MSGDEMREAARLMRERARSAMRDLSEQRWVSGPTIDPDNNGWYVSSDIPEADWDTTVAHLPYDYEGDCAPHIASWHPAVALAVADWLDAEAAASDALSLFSQAATAELEQFDVRGAALTIRRGVDGGISMTADTSSPALAVARSYLEAAS